jgi:D-aminopeptidase
MGLPKPWQDASGCPRGEFDLITDVPGVTVGHFTLLTESLKTGVTVIMPGHGSVFLNKLPARWDLRVPALLSATAAAK